MRCRRRDRPIELLTARPASRLITQLSKQVDLGIWHRLSQLVIVLIVAACLLGLFFWYLPVFEQNERMRQKILALEVEVKAEEMKQAQLQTAIRNLRDDPKTVERLAREKLGFARPGETVIVFERPRPRPAGPGSAPEPKP